jgi:hypothetical protein
MKKYKVEITETRTYCVDVLAAAEPEAVKLALEHFDACGKAGTAHYLEVETGDGPESFASNVYDVTDTDDSFSPVNETPYAARVRELEAEGLTTSDAQGVAMAEGLDARE